MKEVEEIKSVLKSPQEIVVIPHINPDGDALGSCLGLNRYLINKGHSSTVICPNEFPDFYSWMPGMEDIRIYSQNPEESRELIQKATVIFFLDYNDLKRIGDLAGEMENLDAKFIMVDHHRQPTDFADIMISIYTKSSTSEMVFDLIRDLGDLDDIDKEIGECLYTGILTDTGSFRFGSTKKDTHIAAAHLLSVGVEPDYVYTKVYDTNTLDRMHLMGFTLVDRLKTVDGYHAAYITLSEEDQNRFNFKKGDSEGFVNYGLAINGMKMAGFFRESEGFIKVSLRSKNAVDVNVIARQHFNGGGHRNAAGGRLETTLEEAVALFEKVVKIHADELEVK